MLQLTNIAIMVRNKHIHTHTTEIKSRTEKKEKKILRLWGSFAFDTQQSVKQILVNILSMITIL